MSSYLDFNGLKRYHENSKEYVDSKIPTKTSALTNDSGYVTDNDVQAEFDIRNLKTYTSLSQLGKTIDSVTSLKGLLPNDSQLTLTVNNAEKEALYNKGIIPVSAAGVLIVTNYNMRGEARFIQDMVRSIYVGQTSNAWNTDYDWKRLATETDLENLVNSNSTTLEDLGVTATATELNYVDGVTSNIQTQLDGKASTSVSTTSKNGLMSSTDKTKLDNTNIAYATCSTAADTAAKVITISGNTNWKLVAGSMIIIKFSATNTASNPTFNVNGTGAKSVWYNTAVITTSENLGYAGTANRPMNFIYDGTQYVFIGWSRDNNSDTKNTTGTTNKTATKLFLAGATSQGSNPVTYSNSGVYIGTDNCLYSNSKKVTTTTYSTTAPSVREVGTVWIG